MLVLTRKINQKIHIGEEIVVTILKIQGGDQVTVGVEAPRNIPIARDELIAEQNVLDLVKAENQASIIDADISIDLFQN